MIEYILLFQKYSNEILIPKQTNCDSCENKNNELMKQIIELLIKDILNSNPNLDTFRDIYYFKNKKRTIISAFSTLILYPGFTTCFMEVDGGIYLNITLKNRIIQSETILDFLRSEKDKDTIRNSLIGHSFKPSYSNKNYIINDILFDRNPKNQNIIYCKRSISLYDYYIEAHQIKIKDLDQPLLLVRRFGANNEIANIYFIPELCYLAGLDDKEICDRKLMEEIDNMCKKNASDIFMNTNEIIQLFMGSEKRINRLSSKEKSDFYGIKISPYHKEFKAHYIKKPKIFGGNRQLINCKEKTFPPFTKKDMTSWICFYQQKYYDDADYFFKTFLKIGHSIGLKIQEPIWVEMPKNASEKQWVEIADDYFYQNKYSFCVFLINQEKKLYKQLKVHSLCKRGYVSQVVKIKTMKRYNKIFKILLQINAKLGGFSYKVELQEEIKDKDFIIIGVDSSHIKGKRTAVAFVGTINKDLNRFYNKVEIIGETKKEQLQFCVSTFIEEVINIYYKENKNYPGGIIIYRQGVSLQQKKYLKDEMENIDKICKKRNLLYYYIFVNDKITYKFLLKVKGNSFENPDKGLLMMNDITRCDFFEFYLQSHEIEKGTITPVCYHVAYGNMGFPEIIPKLTYDLCYMYSNFEGSIRVPHVMRAAAKLAKITAKYTLEELHPSLKIGQAYI